jgi:hypothetical protein
MGAIRLLVALLAHDLIEDTSLKVTNKNTSIHSLVKTMGEQKTVGQVSTKDLSQTGNDLDTNLEPAAIGVKPGSVFTKLRSPTSGQNGYPSRQISSLHLASRSHRDKEDPEIKLGLKADAAHALWKLAANNVKNSKLITDTRALLCFAKLIETGHGQVKYNSIMAIMEIAAAAEKDKELRRSAFKTNSAAVKAVVECVLRVLEGEADEPDIQVHKFYIS